MSYSAANFSRAPRLEQCVAKRLEEPAQALGRPVDIRNPDLHMMQFPSCHEGVLLTRAAVFTSTAVTGLDAPSSW